MKTLRTDTSHPKRFSFLRIKSLSLGIKTPFMLNNVELLSNLDNEAIIGAMPQTTNLKQQNC